MLSILILSILFVICIVIVGLTKSNWPRYAAMSLLVLLVIEIVTYIIFLLQILKGDCFLLIGNQKVLDEIAKARLSYAIYFSQGKKSFVYQIDHRLGYTIGQSKATGTYQSNAQGFRANRNYTLLPSKNTLRIATFGDSFVFCDDEVNEDSWPYILEHSVDNLEVLNFGVSGYGLSQSYLRYLQDGLRYNPDIIFINYVLTGNRDQIDQKNFVNPNNLRQAHFYRPKLSLDADILLAEGIKPYDLFDPNFRDEYILKSLRPELRSLWLNTTISKTNIGLFLKQFILKKCLLKDQKLNQKELDPRINFVILKDLIELAGHNHTFVIFFCSEKFESLPIDIQNLLKKYSNNVMYVDSTSAMNKVSQEHHVTENIRNKSSHYNRKGNELYAEAVLKVLKSRSWGSNDRKIHFESNNNRFVQE